MKRYEVKDLQWLRIAPMLPGKAGDPGRTAVDNWLFVNAVLVGAAFGRALVGPPGALRPVQERAQAVHPLVQGVWERIFGELTRDRDNEYLMIDSAIARARPGGHRSKGGCKDQALGRSRGGLTSKWHIAVDGQGRPVRFIRTAGQRSDATQALALIDGLPAAHVIADKAYDAFAILNAVEVSGARPIIPQRTCMPRPRAFDPSLYRLRNRIERTIGRLKQLRRIATGYDRIPANSLAPLSFSA